MKKKEVIDMYIKRLGLSVFIVLCMMFLTCMVGFASDTGSVKGKLHKNSASGPALSGAKVTCGGESDKTDDDGKFKIKGIKKGEHTIQLSKNGYESYQTTVKIKAGETANVGDRWLTENSSTNVGFPSCKGIKDTHCASAQVADPYQCTTYVQQNAGWNVGTLGTTLSKKQSRINCSKPKIGAPGSVVVMSLGSTGHVGLVRKVKGDTITIADRNLCCDGKDRQYDVSVNDNKILGFIVNSDKNCLK